jgi:hypothetical protein
MTFEVIDISEEDITLFESSIPTPPPTYESISSSSSSDLYSLPMSSSKFILI